MPSFLHISLLSAKAYYGGPDEWARMLLRGGLHPYPAHREWITEKIIVPHDADGSYGLFLGK